jgi:glutathione S-transferase
MSRVTLYGADTTRSDIVRFALAELGVAYDFRALDWGAGEHKSEAYKQACARALVALRRFVVRVR